MIRCHLARMMGEHKMRIADVARETGLSRATVTLLYKETAQKVDLINAWIAQGRMRSLDARVLLMQIWGMTQHYADYAVQARVMLECADDQPLDREHIARELTTSVLLSCGLAPI